ncbi:Glyco_hydro_9 domain-containing protein/CBM49 domain-containing protein [Cephalotus follicularis]|uniref:Endoglucanase n=1 Tax=Cephalotus follicularis TaxID=3775 RepID=A0A1Q3AZN4_CEPFO|nr:Glyco_hydro_9 domain-containing protein/CBM49 domain-containing protein [Cephalotus follicularis]
MHQVMMRNLNAGVCLLLVCMLGIHATDFNYGDALDKTLMFFQAQRSGRLPLNQRVKWRGDSGLKDGFLQGVNLVGGYYDAGDHVKFGLPMAFSVTMVAWGAIEYRKEITELDQMGHTLWTIKWGTDYFMKAHTEANFLWGQVGDGVSDHYCWERAEDMKTPRNAYKLDPEHPGSDLAGETAAALAAAAIAFKRYDSSYSLLCLVHAKELFSFANRFRGLYDDSIQCAKKFYTSSGYSDELLWAATWLYRATGNEYYLNYVVNNAAYMGGTGWAVKEFSWDNKYAGVQILLSKILMEGQGGAHTATLKQYKAKADYFACACVQKNGGDNIHLTPGGLMYVREWNNMQYASAAAFLLAVYSDYLSAANTKITCHDGQIQPWELLNFAKSQADYILGKNPKSMSYLVGYGPKYPVHVHHRGSSIASIYVLHATVGCVQGFETWYRRLDGNPNVIYGALVGGPDQNDNFTDNRSVYEQTEPTLSGSAPLIGLFSKLQSLSKPKGKSIYLMNHSPHFYAKTVQHNNPVKFLHTITASWTVGQTTYYRHKVIMKNTSQKPVSDLKLAIENLSGSVWGLSPTQEKNTYQLPQRLRVLKPGSEWSFVYVQGGPQAIISILSYH